MEARRPGVIVVFVVSATRFKAFDKHIEALMIQARMSNEPSFGASPGLLNHVEWQ